MSEHTLNNVWLMMPVEILHAVITYFESEGHIAKAVSLWPQKSIQYQTTWVGRFAKGLVHSWEKMDLSTRRRFVAIALDWYQFETTKKG